MRPPRLFALLLCLCHALLVPPLRGETLPVGRVRVRGYGEEQGLGNLNIQAIHQDRAGLIYVGTGSGLFRFDGATFDLVPLAADLDVAAVNALHPHRTSGMWVGTINGLARVQEGRARWSTFQGGSNTPSIWAMVEAPDGALWVNTSRGIYRQDGDLHFAPASLPAAWGVVTGFAQALPGQPIVFMDAKGALHRPRPDGGWDDIQTRRPLPDLLTQDRQGRIWAVHGRDLSRLEVGALAFTSCQQMLKGVLQEQGQLFPSWGGGVWIATGDGFQLIRDGAGEWIPRQRGLPEDSLMIPFEDRQGVLWMGGVGLFRRQGHPWLRAFDHQDGLPSRLVWAIHRWSRDGHLYVGTSEGLARLEDRQFTGVPGGAKLSVVNVMEDAEGTLWVATRNRGLLRLAPGGRELQPEPSFHGTFAQNLARGFNGGVLVFGDTRGPMSVRTLRGKVETQPMPLPMGPMGKPGANRAVVDAQGRLWVTSWFGLHVLEGGTWRTFTTRDGLRLDRVMELLPTSDGEYWIRYEESVGVSRLRYTQGRLEVLETLNPPLGTSPLVPFGVYGTRAGDVWLLTDRGVLARRNGVQTLLTLNDGLPTLDCDENAFHRDADGTVWIGTSQGLVRLDAAMPSQLAPPVARITSVAQPHRRWILTEEPAPSAVRYQDGTLVVRFAADGHGNEGGQTYQVRLEGLEDDWRTTPLAVARYPGLREGTYTFHVRCARVGESWGPIASLKIHVLPPWYRAWWAYTLYVAFGSGLMVLLVRWRLRALTHQRDHLEALVRARTQEIEAARAELEIANESLRAQSLTDPLTGLHNRRFLDVALPQDVRKAIHLHQHAGRNGRRGDLLNPDLVFFLVDLDHFKRVNDSHGHHAGDLVLKQAAMLMRQAIRDTDAVIRWGGEEFLVIARETCRTRGPMMAERICSLVRNHAFEVEEEAPIGLTCSVGFAPFPVAPNEPEAVTWERAVDIADLCLYLAKHSGRNGWVGAMDFESMENRPLGPGTLKAMAEAGKVDLKHSAHQLVWTE